MAGFAAVALFMGAACSSSSSPDAPGGPGAANLDAPPTYVYQVAYKPGVVVLDEATVRASLQDMSDDGATFTFDAAGPGVSQLQPGAVVLVWGLALRKITSVDAQGAKLVVHTDAAALTDAIQDGTIKWDQTIDFMTGGSGNFIPTSGSGRLLDDGGFATNDFKLSIKPGEESISAKIDEYEYKLTFKPTPGTLAVEVEITKKTLGLDLQATFKGFVNKFRTNADIAIAGGETKSASFSNNGLTGELNLSFAAGKPTNAESSENVIIKIPFSYKIPIPMPGGFPAFVQIRLNFAVTMALTSANATAKGSYSIPFHGSAGLSALGGAPDDMASGDMESDPKIGNGTQTASLGVSAMAVQVGFPYIGLGIGISELQAVAYVSQVTSAQMKTPGMLGLIGGCQVHELDLTTNVGANATILGLTINTKAKPVYNKKVELTLPDSIKNCL